MNVSNFTSSVRYRDGWIQKCVCVGVGGGMITNDPIADPEVFEVENCHTTRRTSSGNPDVRKKLGASFAPMTPSLSITTDKSVSSGSRVPCHDSEETIEESIAGQLQQRTNVRTHLRQPRRKRFGDFLVSAGIAAGNPLREQQHLKYQEVQLGRNRVKIGS